MKKEVKRTCLLLCIFALVFAMMLPALASDYTVVYRGHNLFGFGAAGELVRMSPFGSFRGVMPGDVIQETVTVRNDASCCDFVKVYMRMETEDSDEIAAYMGEDRLAAQSMREFLSTLSVCVKNGEEILTRGTLCEGDMLCESIPLGEFRCGEERDITIELSVPASLGNAYEYREGEMRLVFVVEEYDDSAPDTPKTGDAPLSFMYMIFAAVCAHCAHATRKRKR